PLVRQLVRGDEVGEVDLVVTLFLSIQETDALGIRNGVGERLREALIARELDDAVLPIEIRREVRAEVVEAVLRRLEHRRQREGMLRNVIDLELDALVFLAVHGVARRER